MRTLYVYIDFKSLEYFKSLESFMLQALSGVLGTWVTVPPVTYKAFQGDTCDPLISTSVPIRSLLERYLEQQIMLQ